MGFSSAWQTLLWSLRRKESRSSRHDNRDKRMRRRRSRRTEVEMKVSFAALLIAFAAVLGTVPAYAQEAPGASDSSALQKLLQTDLPPERMAIASKLVQVSGVAR